LENSIRNGRENQNRLNQRIRTQIGELNGEKSRLLEEKRALEAKVGTLEQQLNDAQSKVTEAGATHPTQDQSATIVRTRLSMTSRFIHPRAVGYPANRAR
jgi:predicted nuclease with TOPRIM domain